MNKMAHLLDVPACLYTMSAHAAMTLGRPCHISRLQVVASETVGGAARIKGVADLGS